MDKQIEINVSDAMTEMPIRFKIGKAVYSIYPSTLGKTQILKKMYLNLDINAGLLAMNPLAETMRICKEYPDIVCRIIAYSTFADKKSILDADRVSQRTKLLKDTTSVEDLATILSVIFSSDKTEEFIKYFGIDADRELKAKISKIKGDGNSLTFGGKSIYGLLIDFACQRYGWTMDYVLWDISYVNLNMLFADAVTTIYLSDEERKQLGKSGGVVINADDPANRDLVRRMISE